MKGRVLAVVSSLVLAFAVAASAQAPMRNVAGHRHPNLAAAQRLAARAFKRIVQAQKANEWDMAGHAQKARDLLEQANAELKLAAEAANVHRR